MTIAAKIEASIEKSSWIRKMFEAGAKLRAEHGDDKVFDFSIGNPNLKPPVEFQAALEEVAADDTAGVHGYMPNTGYPDVRAAIAKTVKKEQGADATGDDIIITCGAAGGLNVIIKAILNPGEEILVTRPFFVEYTFYAQNHGGELKTVPSKEDFSLDLDAMEESISEKTRIVLVNSPNNPTGKIYTREELNALGALLEKKSKEYGKVIYLVSDEPYRKIVFEDIEIPPVFSCYKNSIVATSHSKDLSLPGERIGYITIGPDTEYKEKLRAAMALTNRILGFVNAPGIMQRVLPHIQDASVDINAYKRKRDLLCKGLSETALEFIVPPGTFYLFPKSPIEDDVKFVKMLQEELILAVPGSGFGAPGYFRLSFCVADDTIKNSIPAFKRVMDKL
jgi:aspartate aminotransferase